MDASLPGLPVTGAAVNVRDHDRHSPVEHFLQEGVGEHRSRLSLGPAVDHEQRRPASRFLDRPPYVCRDRAFGAGDADRLGTLGIFGSAIAGDQEPVLA